MSHIAVLSDVHGDASALERAIALAVKFGCAEFICLGDLISYGSEPLRTVRILKTHRIPCIRGNHDRWAVHDRADFDGRPLATEVVDYLAALPPTRTFWLDGVKLFASHAWPTDDLNGIGPNTLDEDIAELMDENGVAIWLTGHTHQFDARQIHAAAYENKWVFNPGAVLTTSAGAGTFGILDVHKHTFIRFPI